jgi:hypothetical protein
MRQDGVHLDPTGFPMLGVPEIGLYVHGLPVTKMQFEHFLCDATDGHFDSRWYDEILRLNPRVSARRIWSGNYWNAFLSGILPAEAERFAAWCGPGYRLLQTSEWQRLYRALEKQNATSLGETGLFSGLAPHHRDLITQVERAVEDACTHSGDRCHLTERTLMRMGLIEWTAIAGPNPNLWAGLGEPHPSFCGNLFTPAKGDLIQPADSETRRLASFGFRLAFDPELVPQDR